MPKNLKLRCLTLHTYAKKPHIQLFNTLYFCTKKPHSFVAALARMAFIAVFLLLFPSPLMSVCTAHSHRYASATRSTSASSRACPAPSCSCTLPFLTCFAMPGLYGHARQVTVRTSYWMWATMSRLTTISANTLALTGYTGVVCATTVPFSCLCMLTSARDVWYFADTSRTVHLPQGKKGENYDTWKYVHEPMS